MLEAIGGTKMEKATGQNGIINEMLKEGKDIIGPHLTQTFNDLLENNNFELLAQWKNREIVSIWSFPNGPKNWHA